MNAKNNGNSACGCEGTAYGTVTAVDSIPSEGTYSCCIDTYRIYDSCRTQECIEDLRVLVTDADQETLNNASAVRVRSCKILWTQISTEEMPFNKGYFQIDIRYYFYITLDCCLGFGNSREVQGLAIYDKTVILFGGEGNVSVFQSDIYRQFCSAPDLGGMNVTANLPRAVVEVAEPVVLSLNMTETCAEPTPFSRGEPIPESICACFGGSFFTDCVRTKNVFVTIGVFSVVRIERPSQIVIPACEVCIPDKTCDSSSAYSDPCTLFRSMSFPIEEFYPAVSTYSGRNTKEGCTQTASDCCNGQITERCKSRK
ncbi:MAG: hypothetical protein E7665_01495 [Ruminococcaceae bacterium]|nr:hypothetical protein [Oscillospiraceae bacterium]